MKILGKTNFMLNPSIGFVVEPYDGSADPNNPFPSDAATGRLIFRTDEQQIYICVSDNPIVWQPLIKVTSSYIHNQTTNATTWNIQHNLETTNVLVQVYDTNGNKVIPEEINIVDKNNITITFSTNFAGKALIIALDTHIGAFVQENKLSQDVLKSDQDITNVIYDENDNPTEVDYGDGSKAILTYVPDGQNGAGKVKTIEFYNSSNVLIEKWTYTYDSNDRLIQATKTTS